MLLACVLAVLSAAADRDSSEAALPLIALPPTVGLRLEGGRWEFSTTVLTGVVHRSSEMAWLTTVELGITAGALGAELLARTTTYRLTRVGPVVLGGGPTLSVNAMAQLQLTGGLMSWLEVRVGLFALRFLASVEVSAALEPVGTLSVGLGPPLPLP